MVFEILVDFGVPADPDDSDADIMEFGDTDDPRVVHLVADDRSAVVGSVIVRPMGGSEAKLSKLFVLPSARRRGIGRALMEQALEEARRRGYDRLEINTRAVYEEAIRLYESSGWRRGTDKAGPGPTVVYHYQLGS